MSSRLSQRPGRANALPASQLPPSEATEVRLPASPLFSPDGNSAADLPVFDAANQSPGDATQVAANKAVTTESEGGDAAHDFSPATGASYRADENRRNQPEVIVPSAVAGELTLLMAGLGVNLTSPTLGRKHVFDEFMQGRLVSLLAMGLSLRQSGSALGVSHVAIAKHLAGHPELAEQINAARFQAQIEPLLVILRESKRSWRAATWLVNYLTRQIAVREETPDESLARVRQEEIARRDQRRADEKDRKEYDRQVREREELRELHKRQAENMATYGGPSPKERRNLEAHERKVKELFEKLEAES